VRCGAGVGAVKKFSAMEKKEDMYQGWLILDEIMLKRHGEELWDMLKQGMQSAYFMGGLNALNANASRETLWKQCELGLTESLRTPVKVIRKGEQ
jgi:hypothetical protein